MRYQIVEEVNLGMRNLQDRASARQCQWSDMEVLDEDGLQAKDLWEIASGKEMKPEAGNKVRLAQKRCRWVF